MSRHHFDVDEKRAVTVGYDRPMGTFYAQLWDRDHDDDFDFGSPAAVVGYHDAEKIPPLAGRVRAVPGQERRGARQLHAARVERAPLPDEIFLKLSREGEPLDRR
jgi:hypothetical protein